MKTIFLILFFSSLIFSQQFTVEKVSGEVKLLRGTSEKWEAVKVNQILKSSDLLMTNSHSLIQLKNENGNFLIKGDVAIGLKNIKKTTVSDLILSLAMEEIRNVPKTKKSGLAKNTAVYGSDVSQKNNIDENNFIGKLKLNGAKYLNEKGLKESSIIVAKEVFRNYPSLSNNFEDRIYFASLLNELDLFEESLREYNSIEKLELTENQKIELTKLKEEVNLKLVK
ncbi:MAG: hypothetical protein IPM32_01250 [Ignavibacteriae bacterium]|nr:hypothetical protein [Ignavibacteriota bacterium]